MSYRAVRASCRRLGFTLVEVAIVLGICGLLIFGVYSAMSSSRSSHVADEVTTNLGQVVDNVRNYYARGGGADAVTDKNCTATGANTSFEELNFATGIFPLHMKKLFQDNIVDVGVCDLPAGTPRIFVHYTRIPSYACHNVVMGASFAGVDMELSKIVVFGKETNMFLIDEALGSSAANVDVESRHIKVNSPLLFASCPPNPASAFVNMDFYYKLRP